LCAIGEFGSRYAAMRLPDGTFPATRFLERPMAEARIRYALVILATIQAAAGTDRHMKSIWDRELSVGEPIFTLPYRQRLARIASTFWAENLDERGLGLILWMVEEYGIRVNSSRGLDGGEYPPPIYEGAFERTRPMHAALQLIAKINQGEHITAAEVSHYVPEG
jgi:hypothetical protein